MWNLVAGYLDRAVAGRAAPPGTDHRGQGPRRTAFLGNRARPALRDSAGRSSPTFGGPGVVPSAESRALIGRFLAVEGPAGARPVVTARAGQPVDPALRRILPLNNKMGQEWPDLPFPHRPRVRLAVEQDERPGPEQVGVLGPDAGVPVRIASRIGSSNLAMIHVPGFVAFLARICWQCREELVNMTCGRDYPTKTSRSSTTILSSTLGLGGLNPSAYGHAKIPLASAPVARDPQSAASGGVPHRRKAVGRVVMA